MSSVLLLCCVLACGPAGCVCVAAAVAADTKKTAAAVAADICLFCSSNSCNTQTHKHTQILTRLPLKKRKGGVEREPFVGR